MDARPKTWVSSMAGRVFCYRRGGGVNPRAVLCSSERAVRLSARRRRQAACCVVQPLKTADARRFALRESGCERFGDQCVRQRFDSVTGAAWECNTAALWASTHTTPKSLEPTRRPPWAEACLRPWTERYQRAAGNRTGRQPAGSELQTARAWAHAVEATSSITPSTRPENYIKYP